MSCLGLLAALAAEVLGRWLAEMQFGAASLTGAAVDVLTSLRLFPVALVAVYCMRGAVLPAPRAVRWILGLTVPLLGGAAYQSEYGARLALTAHRWTAAGLAGGFPWMGAIVLVIIVGEVSLFLAARTSRRARATRLED